MSVHQHVANPIATTQSREAIDLADDVIATMAGAESTDAVPMHAHDSDMSELRKQLKEVQKQRDLALQALSKLSDVFYFGECEHCDCMKNDIDRAQTSRSLTVGSCRRQAAMPKSAQRVSWLACMCNRRRSILGWHGATMIPCEHVSTRPCMS